MSSHASLVCSGALKGWRQLPFSWRARLLAWPGALTFLSLLAVLLGAQQHPPDPQPRLTAAPVAPALPEVRPLPGPAAPVPLPGAPATEPFRVVLPPAERLGVWWAWSFVPRALTLVWWGRQQTDGA